MAILKSEKIEKDAVEMGASMMALAARTAPKGRGLDSVKTLILTGKQGLGTVLGNSQNYGRLQDIFSSSERRVEGELSNLRISGRHLIQLAGFGGKGDRQ